MTRWAGVFGIFFSPAILGLALLSFIVASAASPLSADAFVAPRTTTLSSIAVGCRHRVRSCQVDATLAGLSSGSYRPLRRFTKRGATSSAPAASSSLSAASDDTISSPPDTQQEPRTDSACPFSMPFPRYRIDLTPGRSERPPPSAQSPFGRLFEGLKYGADRSAIEGRYSTEAAERRLRWVDCRSNADEGATDDGRVRSYAGVRAAAAFWRAASDFATSSVSAEKAGYEDDRFALALLGVDSLMACRLADVVNWLADQVEEGTFPEMEGVGATVRADVDDEAAVPVVVFTRSSKGVDSAGVMASNSDNGTDSISDDIVVMRLKSWVRRVLVDLSICPFTKSDARSGQGLSDLGVPVGQIAYHHSRSSPESVTTLMADAWEAILDMMEAGDSGRNGVSSILLAAPGFDAFFPFWAGPVFAMLETTVTATKSESLVGVVCFHPNYLSPDGSTFPGFGHMHSVPRLRRWLDERDPELSAELTDGDVAAGGAWQRRTPHATINVLRADQLERAEERRDTPELYTRNIGVLVGTSGERDGVGCPKLEKDLEKERRLQ